MKPKDNPEQGKLGSEVDRLSKEIYEKTQQIENQIEPIVKQTLQAEKYKLEGMMQESLDKIKQLTE